MKAQDIEGWMEGGALTYLAKQAKLHKVIVEIGVWKGRSSACMAAATDGILYSVDHFKGNPKAHKTVHKQAVDDRDGLIRECRANLHEYLQSGKCKLLVMESKRAAAGLKRLGIVPDMVFIDGDHDTAAVKKDIEIWLPMIKRGGLLCGHDINWASVNKAVTGAFGKTWNRIDRCCVWSHTC